MKLHRIVLLCLALAAPLAAQDTTPEVGDTLIDRLASGFMLERTYVAPPTGFGFHAWDPSFGTGGFIPVNFSSHFALSGGALQISSSLLNTKFNTPSGSTAQYIRGDGSLATFPTIPAASSVTVTDPITNAGTATSPVIGIAPATTSSAGSMSAAAVAKLATISEEQRTIVTVGSNGRATWTYPVAYGTGVVPVIQANPVKPTSSTAAYNVQIYGDPTNTSVTVEVTTVINSGTIAVLGGLLQIVNPAPTGTKVHLMAKAP